ncbi:MAG: LOW QUALITY PROTEIN: P-loop containing nucleoside triphosphate hydrolase protein [Olpidium bornovanus]|uniref:P-loop containing nucleoside triphosphate hydrolase protein n=1 Tax=Olpidium bornovanus TaxID=278681 RepID=A0A8H7ZX05_9FUNG|nr:MAG: LOW QUALITY PROTEIN: P-loop containing nucleoside triphosphate hydrolase protein [Olpidium bornovanus]
MARRFPGHMAKGMRMIRERAGQADLIIEVRDARIPLASINTEFEAAIGLRDRIILYNKADLAEASLQKVRRRVSVVANGLRRRSNVMFGSLKRPGDNAARGILHYAAGAWRGNLTIVVKLTNADGFRHQLCLLYFLAKALADPILYPHFTIMVVGMPNVGKSSLINALRRVGTGKKGEHANLCFQSPACLRRKPVLCIAGYFRALTRYCLRRFISENVLRVAPIPGVTTSMHHRINIFEKPPIFVIDTPGGCFLSPSPATADFRCRSYRPDCCEHLGVMIPYIPDPLGALKVALTGGIHDHLADEELMSDYLLYAMNVRNNFSYVQRYNLPGPTDSIQELLTGVAKRLHMLCKGGVYNFHGAAQFFLRDYRRGTFGAFTIDDVDEKAMDNYFAHALPMNPENVPEFDEEGNRLISKTAMAKRKKALLLAKAMRRSASKGAAS